MSDIIVPSNGNGKEVKEELKEVLLFKAIMVGEKMNLTINDAVQLRDVSHAIRILNLMLDGGLARKQMEENAKKIQPVTPVPHGIINAVRRGFKR